MERSELGRRDTLRGPLVWFYAWLVLGWLMILTVIVFSLTSVPIPVGLFEYQDKAEHVLAYFAMMGWFVQLYRRRRHLLLLVLIVGMGIALEFLQSLTPDRVFEFADMAANSLGALLAWLLGGTRFAVLLAWFERRVLGASTAGDNNP